MALELIIGPAHAGKIAELYRRHLDVVASGAPAVLVVPDRAARIGTERELLARAPAILGADVVTFDALFERIVRAAGDDRPVLRGAARRLLLRRALDGAPDALAGRLDRLGSALLDPAAVRDGGDAALADAYAAWWAALDAAGALDPGRVRIAAVAALRREVGAWPAGCALLAQGFDDLSPAQEQLLHLVAQRARAVASLPYEAGRPAFAVLRGVVERLAERAGPGGILELAPLDEGRAGGLVALERRLGERDPDRAAPAPAGDAVAMGEAEGSRGEAELVLDEVLGALRAGVRGSRIAIIAPHGADGRERLVDRLRAAGIAVDAGARGPLGRTPFGRALLALLALAWADEPTDDDRLTWLRSPWSGAPTHLVERCERPYRRSLDTLGNALERGGEPILGALALPAGVRGGSSPAAEARAAVRAMLRRAHGDRAPAVLDAIAEDLAVATVVLEALDELDEASPPATRGDVREALADLPTGRPVPAAEAVRLLDPRAARTADLDVAVAIGFEDALLGVGLGAAREPLVEAPDPADVARHLAYSAATRPRRRLVLIRRVADDDGSPLAATAIWEDLVAAAGEPPVRRRRFDDVVLPLAEAPTVADRARSLARLAAVDRGPALRLAARVGVAEAVGRALAASRRGTALADPRVLGVLAERDPIGVTELDRFGDCSQIWFVERRLDPKAIDQPIDDRLRVGVLIHSVLGRLYREVPGRLGTTVIGPAEADRAVAEVERLVDEEVARLRPVRSDDRLRLQLLAWGLRRDLGRLVRRAARAGAPLVPSEFEVSFGGRGGRPGVDVGPVRVSGKIDRIDADPAFTARALVVDYKTSSISTGSEIVAEGRLQIPLYLLALRESLGREPVGGLLVSVRKGEARGLVDEEHGDVLPSGLATADRLDHAAFEAALEQARSTAAQRVERMRAGDVRHDPRDADLCVRHCAYAGICRVGR